MAFRYRPVYILVAGLRVLGINNNYQIIIDFDVQGKYFTFQMFYSSS